MSFSDVCILDFFFYHLLKNSYFLPQPGRTNARGDLEIDCGSCDTYWQFWSTMTVLLYQILTKDAVLLEKNVFFLLYIFASSSDFCLTNILLFFLKVGVHDLMVWKILEPSQLKLYFNLFFIPRNWQG